MGYVVPLFIRLDLTWAFTTFGYIRASVHSVHSGLAIHGPVGPCPSFVGDEDSGGSSTAHHGGVEVQTATYLRGGSGNDYIGGTLRHNCEHELLKLNLV
ncbi:C5 protein [Malvastrum leaf curl Philippines virus]|uniref:C5 protein n=1 Tax=Malvastrum leaf curl Philippines virus TaxID=1333313 RepID=R4QU91_9GEMI|nr:C5 protein [Malvastrum leaf curl Philippines virus]AGL74877.1 C5 protein [Malvastrum leaf curl Philippines virus]